MAMVSRKSFAKEIEDIIRNIAPAQRTGIGSVYITYKQIIKCCKQILSGGLHALTETVLT